MPQEAAKKKPRTKTAKASGKKPSGRKNSPAPKKRGRPPGSKTREANIVREFPPACRVCHSTDLVIVPGSAPRVINQAGTLEGNDAKRYTQIIVRRKRCGQCGQRLDVKSYAFDPNKWIGK